VELNDDRVVVVVGSGAGGATVANELCQRGIRCVLLEAGPRFTLADFSHDELAMAAKLAWPDVPEVTSPEPLSTSKPYVCKGVGGTTLHWSGIALRLSASERRARQVYGEITGSTLADWPVPDREFDEYYSRAEARLGVAGTHGNPLLPGNNNFKVLYNGARRIGYRNISTGTLAINSRARDGRPGCIQMGFCLQGCRIGAKWSTLYTEIPRAEETGRLDLRAGCTALRIEHDARGRASGVVYVDASGRMLRQKAHVVCVAANAVESARLLLNSASSTFPDGLGNSSGLVGRNYMTHNHVFVMARMPKPVHAYRGTVQAGLVADERPHRPERGFAGGYMLEQIAFGLPLTTLALQSGKWGAPLGQFIGGYANLAGLVVLGEELPQEGNSVTLSRTRVDSHGMPIASIHRRLHVNDRTMMIHAVERASALYRAVGAEQIYVAEPTGTTHNVGTARMSARSSGGVVNSWGQAHDIPNLFVSDGSQFVTSGAANPTLTIVALAIRQGEYIARRLKARTL
jgi:choline dehydrogenase-like flavoprotein